MRRHGATPNAMLQGGTAGCNAVQPQCNQPSATRSNAKHRRASEPAAESSSGSDGEEEEDDEEDEGESGTEEESSESDEASATWTVRFLKPADGAPPRSLCFAIGSLREPLTKSSEEFRSVA